MGTASNDAVDRARGGGRPSRGGASPALGGSPRAAAATAECVLGGAAAIKAASWRSSRSTWSEEG
jgi:hypothetical protein